MQEMAPNTNALQTSMGMTRQSLKRVTQTRKMPSNSNTLAMCRMGRIINNIGTQSRKRGSALIRGLHRAQENPQAIDHGSKGVDLPV